MKSIPIRSMKTPNVNVPSPTSFSIREVKQILAGNDMVQELHRHDFFFLLALQKGTGQHEIDFKPYQVKDYSIAFMRPGQVHRHSLKAGGSGYLLTFKPDFYTPSQLSLVSLWQQPMGNFLQLNSKSFKKLFTPLESIFREYTDRQEAFQNIIKANLDIFFIELLRLQDQRLALPAQSYTQKRLADFLALLETQYVNNKKVAQYAVQLNLSPYQLNAITKATLGKNCSTLINEQILLEAKRQLLATSKQVNQIADQLGYTDVSYFIRFFKKHTHQTPDAFRHNFK